jgi:hypothetical protein
LDVDAEHSGEDCGWEFGGEGEQRGRAVLPRLETDLLEALAEPVVTGWAVRDGHQGTWPCPGGWR